MGDDGSTILSVRAFLLDAWSVADGIRADLSL